MTIANVLAAANTILAAIILLQVFSIWRRTRHTSLGWLRFLQIVVSALWIVLSFFLLITPENAAQAEIGRLLARPLNTFTLAIMAASAIIGAKRT